MRCATVHGAQKIVHVVIIQCDRVEVFSNSIRLEILMSPVSAISEDDTSRLFWLSEVACCRAWLQGIVAARITHILV